MSKFFQALENAERERAADALTATVSVAPPELPRPAEETVVPSSRPPAPPSRPPVAGPVASAPTARAAPAGAYGAPVARGRRGAHRTFLDSLEPPVAEDPGTLDDHLVSLLAPTSFAAEQYRSVRLAIERHHREHGLQVVAISSPGRGEGKTVTAINLAGALAQAPDARVALIDADLRHPKVARYLGMSPGPGLSAYLLDQTLGVTDVIQTLPAIALSVVLAGPPSAMPYELLKSPRFTALFQALRAEFDYVVVDTPPVLLFPDVGILRDAVDGFVIVIRANHTPREGVVDGLDTVGRHRVIGVVFNDDARHPAVTAAVESERGWRRYVGSARSAS